RPADVARVPVLFPRLQHEAEALEASQRAGARRPGAGEPHGVGDEDGVGAQPAARGADHLVEALRPDLLLELPQDAEVDGQTALAGGADPEERGERRPLVVGGAAAEAAVPFAREDERLGAPDGGGARRG